MVTIMAICEHALDSWVVMGHTRETAEDAYRAYGHFYKRPLYRVVVTERPRPRLAATPIACWSGPKV